MIGYDFSPVMTLRAADRILRKDRNLAIDGLPFAVTDLGCALVALWLYVSPTLGAARALLIASTILCAVWFAALALMLRTRNLPSPFPTQAVVAASLLCLRTRLFNQRDGFGLTAAFLTGAFFGRGTDPAPSLWSKPMAWA